MHNEIFTKTNTGNEKSSEVKKNSPHRWQLWELLKVIFISLRCGYNLLCSGFLYFRFDDR